MKVRIDWDGRVRCGWLVIIMNSQEVSYFTHTHTHTHAYVGLVLRSSVLVSVCLFC